MLPINVQLSPRIRGVLYQVVFWLGVLTAILIAVFGALGGGWPVWFKAYVAGSAALGSALGLTASSNLPTSKPTVLAEQPNEEDTPNLDFSELGVDPDPDLNGDGRGDNTGQFKRKLS